MKFNTKFSQRKISDVSFTYSLKSFETRENKFRMESSIRVHRCAVYAENPSSVQVMRYDEESSRLAVARQNGTIEIWSQYERRCWDQQGCIPPDEDRPIDVLEWTKYGYLISGGINGAITQYCPLLYKVNLGL